MKNLNWGGLDTFFTQYFCLCVSRSMFSQDFTFLFWNSLKSELLVFASWIFCLVWREKSGIQRHLEAEPLSTRVSVCSLKLDQILFKENGFVCSSYVCVTLSYSVSCPKSQTATFFLFINCTSQKINRLSFTSSNCFSHGWKTGNVALFWYRFLYLLKVMSKHVNLGARWKHRGRVDLALHPPMFTQFLIVIHDSVSNL